MGRGNICTHYECEGLYYLDRDLLDVYRKVNRCGCGHVTGRDYSAEEQTARELTDAGIECDYDGKQTGWAYDEAASRDNWDEMVQFVAEKFSERFPSFQRVNDWKDRDRRVVLRSGLFEIAVADNEWSAAWLLLERSDIDDVGSNRTFMRRHHRTYLKAIKNLLIQGWGEAIAYGGPWTHGRKYTGEEKSICLSQNKCSV